MYRIIKGRLSDITEPVTGLQPDKTEVQPMITGQNVLPKYEKQKLTEHQRTTNGRTCDMGINNQIHLNSDRYQKVIWNLVIVANVNITLFHFNYIYLTYRRYHIIIIYILDFAPCYFFSFKTWKRTNLLYRLLTEVTEE